MTKGTGKRQGTQAGNGAGAGWAEVLAPLVTGMTATRARLLEWVHAHGLVALQAVFKAEAAGRAQGASMMRAAPITTGARPPGG